MAGRVNENDDFQSLRDEVFRRIGRNLVQYQQLEHSLKVLISTGKFGGPIRELAEILERKRTSVRQSTMGILSGLFTDGFLSEASDSEAPTPTFDRASTISVTFIPELDAAMNEELRQGLAAAVTDRNELAHQLHLRWDGTTVESTRQMLVHLDEQRERLRPTLEMIQGMAASLREGLKRGIDELSQEDRPQS